MSEDKRQHIDSERTSELIWMVFAFHNHIFVQQSSNNKTLFKYQPSGAVGTDRLQRRTACKIQNVC